MTDKPISKRANFKQARVALKHLAKPEPQQVPQKLALRPLREQEKVEIVTRARRGESCQKIASEMGIPFVLVHRYLGGA